MGQSADSGNSSQRDSFLAASASRQAAAWRRIVRRTTSLWEIAFTMYIISDKLALITYGKKGGILRWEWVENSQTFVLEQLQLSLLYLLGQ